MRLQLDVISRPDLLRSAYHANSQLAEDHEAPISKSLLGSEPGKVPYFSKKRARCSCHIRSAGTSRRESPSTLYSRQNFCHQWSVQAGLVSKGRHHRTCPMYFTSPSTSTARLSIRIGGVLLSGAVEASFSIIRGAGGFSISPMLQCARVMDSTHSIFRLTDLSEREIPAVNNMADFQGFMDGTLQEIERLFREGRASPQDVDIDGNTLLHVRQSFSF